MTRFNIDTGEMMIDESGREVVDRTRISLPIKFSRPEPVHLRLRRMILSAIEEQRIANNGNETLEEATDFSIDDDPDSFDSSPSRYEENYDHLSNVQHELQLEKEALLLKRKAAQAAEKEASVDKTLGLGAGAPAPTPPVESPNKSAV